MYNKKYQNLILSTILSMVFPCHAISAESPSAINKRGVELGEKKMYKEAVSEFDRAIDEYNKDSAMTYHNRGWALELSGNTEGAIASYEEALRRNPSQTITGEKLGFIYYKKGNYINAVRVGELVLKYDPDNQEVIKWLSDAYTKKLKQEREMRLAKKETVKETAEKEKEQRKKRKKDMILFASFDFMIRTGYYFAGNTGYRYVSDKGAIVDIPENLTVRFSPIKAWEFSFIAENPYLGALTPPEMITQQETAESLYMLGSFKLGIGFMLSHHKSSNLSFGEDLSLMDFKTGFLFGYVKDKMDFDIRFYPRFLPHDGESSNNHTLDTGLLDFRYTYNVNKELKYYSIFTFRDYYIFDHTNKISDYYGAYDIGLGVTLGNININNHKFTYALTIEFRERFYLRNLENDDPYSMVPNGQGWFGMDMSQWVKGDPFSGFWALGSELSFRIDEQFLPNMFVYQKIIVEMGDMSKDHHEFNFKLGVGGMY